MWWHTVTHGRGCEEETGELEWVASTLHTSSECGLSSITTADAHTSAASSRLNWRPRRFKWTHPFRRKTKSGICSCASTFQTQSTTNYTVPSLYMLLAVLYSVERRVFLGGPYSRQAGSKRVEVSYNIRTHRGLQCQFWAVIALKKK